MYVCILLDLVSIAAFLNEKSWYNHENMLKEINAHYNNMID